MKKWFGFLGGTVSLLFASTSVRAADKLQEWKKYRNDIEVAVACEKGFVENELHQIETDKQLQLDAVVQNTIKPRLLARKAKLDAVSVDPIKSDQTCDAKISASLSKYLSTNPHKDLEEVETSIKSSIGNYLFGRWGVHQARLGKGDRLLTTSAWQIKDKLTSIRDELRRPAKEFGQDEKIQKNESDTLLKYWISLQANGGPEDDHIANAIDDNFHNTGVNGVFLDGGTGYEQIRYEDSSAPDDAMVASVVPSGLKASEVFNMKDGEKETVVKATTYGLVFFKQVKGAPVPAAISPSFAKLVKPGQSNLNCHYNQSPIQVDAKDKQSLGSGSGQTVSAKAMGTGSQNSDGSRKQVFAVVKVSGKDETYLHSCVPLTMYEGSGEGKKIVLYFGIPINK